MVERGIDVHPQQVDFSAAAPLPAAVAMACTIFGKPSCRWVAMPSSTLRPAIAGNARGCTEDVGAVESTARRSESPGVYVLQHVVIPTNSGLCRRVAPVPTIARLREGRCPEVSNHGRRR